MVPGGFLTGSVRAAYDAVAADYAAWRPGYPADLVAFLAGSTPRVRFHGLQAILLGAVWPLLLYAATWTSPVVTQVIGAAGLLLWVVLVVATNQSTARALAAAAGRHRLTVTMRAP